MYHFRILWRRSLFGLGYARAWYDDRCSATVSFCFGLLLMSVVMVLGVWCALP